MPNSLALKELDYLHETVSPEERDELLQCQLVAAAISAEAVLQEWGGGKMLGQLTR